MRHARGAVRLAGWRWWLIVALGALMLGCATTASWKEARREELADAIRRHDLALAGELIRRNPRALDDKLALDIALRQGDLDAIRHFTARTGVNVVLDEDGATPLIRAAGETPPEARDEVVYALVSLGADPTLTDHMGRNAAYHARHSASVPLAEWLEQRIDALARPAGASLPTGARAWLSDLSPPSLVAAGPGATLAARGRGAKAAQASSRARKSVASGLLASHDASFVTRAEWLPRVRPGAGATADAGYAAFRFHADGTGQLLRYVPSRKSLEAVPNAFVAWEFKRPRLAFFVLAEPFSVLCESVSATRSEIAFDCHEYHLRAGRGFRDPRQFVSLDGARLMLENPRSRSMSVGTLLTIALVRDDAGLCKPQRVDPADAAVPAPERQASGDWYAFDPHRFQAYAPLTGMACRQSQAQAAALAACRKLGRSCRAIGGCPAGQVSAVASLPGHDWAWVGCDTDLAAARQAALDRCRSAAGCDCQLIAVSGRNLNTYPQAACRR